MDTEYLKKLELYIEELSSAENLDLMSNHFASYINAMDRLGRDSMTNHIVRLVSDYKCVPQPLSDVLKDNRVTIKPSIILGSRLDINLKYNIIKSYYVEQATNQFLVNSVFDVLVETHKEYMTPDLIARLIPDLVEQSIKRHELKPMSFEDEQIFIGKIVNSVAIHINYIGGMSPEILAPLLVIKNYESRVESKSIAANIQGFTSALAHYVYGLDSGRILNISEMIGDHSKAFWLANLPNYNVESNLPLTDIEL